MKTKICYKCKEEKEIQNFYPHKTNKDGHRSYCKQCQSIKSLKTIHNEQRIIELGNQHKKRCPKCHKVKKFNEFGKSINRMFGIAIYCKQCISVLGVKNREQNNKRCRLWGVRNKEKISKYNKKWNKKNRLYYKKYNKKRKKEDVCYRIRMNLSARLTQTVQNNRKSASILKLIGCDLNYLKKYLEEQFFDGMSWDNYGYWGWHIDHIRPCASFDLSKPEEQRKCFHYSNLQPLWAKDNLSKGSKYTALDKQG